MHKAIRNPSIVDDQIKVAEEKLGFPLLEELTEFYNKIGHGFFWRKNNDSFDKFL